MYLKNVKSPKVLQLLSTITPGVIVLSFSSQAGVSYVHFKRFHGFAMPQLPQVVE